MIEHLNCADTPLPLFLLPLPSPLLHFLTPLALQNPTFDVSNLISYHWEWFLYIAVTVLFWFLVGFNIT